MHRVDGFYVRKAMKASQDSVFNLWTTPSGVHSLSGSFMAILHLRRQLAHTPRGGSPMGLQIKMGEPPSLCFQRFGPVSHIFGEEIRPWTLHQDRFLLSESNGGSSRFLYPYALQNVNGFANYGLESSLTALCFFGIVVSEAFQVATIIEKLPSTWKDFKNYLKHKRKEMNVKKLINRLRIEEDNKRSEKKTALY
ncbi:hypothetical protein FNV43_RR11055 [Rhamnella rubrinervis]|uniref:Uncharacterized protein n=1 Tax=Rhamnella rubrinervis TaxID=2594499 RepID=A0A8K0H598_9ROSA|nr:hypothetical protein FNV43_RR11055 [Rhamnella rubrinervis]